MSHGGLLVLVNYHVKFGVLFIASYIAGSLPAEAVVQSQEQSPVVDDEVPLPIEAAPIKITPPVQSEGSKAAESLLATLDAPTPPHPQVGTSESNLTSR